MSTPSDLFAKAERLAPITLGGERIRRNVTISGRRTSVSLERAVWDALADIGKRERLSMMDLFTLIDQRRLDASLASGLRVFVLLYFRVLADVRDDDAKQAAGRRVAEDSATPRSIFAQVIVAFEQGRRQNRSGVNKRLGRRFRWE